MTYHIDINLATRLNGRSGIEGGAGTHTMKAEDVQRVEGATAPGGALNHTVGNPALMGMNDSADQPDVLCRVS